jgi:hypothetical protein
MASDDKKAKATPAPKKEIAAKKEPAAIDKSASSVEPAKAEGSEKTEATPKSYSRGEGQKPVTQAYKDSWNVIFANKKKKKR